MARRKTDREPIQDSLRWPTSFANAERMQLLVASEAWQAVVADLRQHHQEQAFKITHEVPKTTEDVMQQNFERGRLAGWEWILEFEEELQEWREQSK
jgi:hypothetical protein